MSNAGDTHSAFEIVVAILLSFILASSLNVYPLSADMALIRPSVMIMVLIFWLMFQPRYTGLFTAFTIGLIGDLILDTRLGQQAFAAVVMALVIKVASIYIKQLTTLGSWLLACFCLFVFQLTLWVVQFITQNIFVPQAGMAMLMSMACWPLVLIALRRYTH
ncbi:MAG: rod shape-determining protein MreD [Psychrobacter sp.]|nr:rod shape-determining protein MreD [Psychrobacter sp.]